MSPSHSSRILHFSEPAGPFPIGATPRFCGRNRTWSIVPLFQMRILRLGKDTLSVLPANGEPSPLMSQPCVLPLGPHSLFCKPAHPPREPSGFKRIKKHQHSVDGSYRVTDVYLSSSQDGLTLEFSQKHDDCACFMQEEAEAQRGFRAYSHSKTAVLGFHPSSLARSPGPSPLC